MTKQFDTINPATGEVIATLSDMDANDVSCAIEAARGAFGHWGQLSVTQRCDYLRKVRDNLISSTDEIMDLICSETGKPPTEALLNEILVASETIDFYIKQAPKALSPTRVSSGLLMNKKAWKTYSPLGVVGVISPWNYPLTLTMTPVITALAAGNTVVLKPSEITPLVGLKVGELIASAGYPDIVKVVTGTGETGAALVNGGVDMVAFTGSVATGKKVAVQCASQLIPCLLELGGKDPMIVCEDADIDRAANACVWGAFTNAGQTCISVERVYVAEKIYDKFVAKVVERTNKLKMGTDIGSMTFPPQITKVENHVRDALQKGARVLTGGQRSPLGAKLANNLYYEPTVLVDVDNSMDIMTEETFGPILPIVKFSTDDEAIKLANDSKYGLSSSVFSKSSSRRKRIANELNAGSVSINDCLVSYAIASLPFGGVKESGLGRAHGVEGLYQFTKVKAIAEDRTGLKSDPQWFPKRSKIESIVKRFMSLRYASGALSKIKGTISISSTPTSSQANDSSQ